MIHLCPGDKELCWSLLCGSVKQEVLKPRELFVKDTGRTVPVAISMQVEMAQ